MSFVVEFANWQETKKVTKYKYIKIISFRVY